MKLKFKVYECDDCHKRAGEFADDNEARAQGWVISHNRKKFYCPRCAPNHKHTGCKGAKFKTNQNGSTRQIRLDGI